MTYPKLKIVSKTMLVSGIVTFMVYMQMSNDSEWKPIPTRFDSYDEAENFIENIFVR